MPSPPRILLIMGVAGCGKSTVGRRLADDLGWEYHEADDFHPPANVAKMSRGEPLNDTDRAPWLAAIRARIDESLTRGAQGVFTCSALKAAYRDVLMGGLADVGLVHLHCDPETILQRVNSRPGHFMKANMVQSQFEALEPPADAFKVDVRVPVAEIIAQIRQRFSL